MNDKDYEIKVLQTLGKNFFAKCSDANWLKSILYSLTIHEEKLLKMLLTFGEVKCLLNTVFFDGEAELEKLYKELNTKKISFKKFRPLMNKLFISFIEKRKSFASLFWEDSVKEGTFASQYNILYKLGICPIAKFSHPSFKMSADGNVYDKLKSFVKIRDEYEENKIFWDKKIASSKLKYIEPYSELLDKINNADDRKELSSGSYKRFIKHWLDKVNENETVSPGLRTKFLEKMNTKGSEYCFTNIDKEYMFGYGPCMLNILYNAKDLWIEEDIIGNDDYVKLVNESYHFQKDYIGISTRSAKEATTSLRLGYNYLKYKMEFQDGRIAISLNNNSVKLYGNISWHKDLHNFEIVTSDHNKGIYKVRFNSDSKNRVTYAGLVKELKIYFKGEQIIVNMSISSCFHEGKHTFFSLNATESDCLCKFKYVCSNAKGCDGKYSKKSVKSCGKAYEESLKNTQNYFKSAPDPTKKEKRSTPSKKIKAMGVDLGLKTPFVATIATVTPDPLSSYNFRIGDHFENIRSLKEHKSETKLDNLILKILCVKKLVYLTRNMAMGHYETIKRKFFIKNIGQVDWANVLGIDYDSYLKEVGNLPTNITEDRDNVVRLWTSKNVKWSLKDIIKSLKQNIIVMRNERLEEKNGHASVTFTLYKKIKIIRSYIDLQKMFSNGVDVGKDLYKYYTGLRRKISNFIASDIVNIAVKKGVDIIFVEDLDNRPSAFLSSEENLLKSLWSVSGIKKWITVKANKHNIIIVSVDPYYTSQIDYETGLLGYRKGRNLYVNDKTIDADLNAAKNILRRGIMRHADLPEFPIDQIEDNLYRLNIVSTVESPSKRKIRAAKSQFGSTSVLLSEHDGELRVVRKTLSKDECDKKVSKDKRTFCFRHGKRLMFTHVVKNQVKLVENMDI